MTTTSSTSGGGLPEGRSSRISQKQRSPSDGTDSSSCSTREPWISTNKILNSSLCGRRINSRNPNFDYDETKLLISLWGDPVVQKTLITTHKKHPVIAELARKMRAHGYNRSTEEINTRIKNLKCFYNRIKKDMAAGIINQTTWRHYAEMDEIISRPVFGNAARIQQQQQQTKPAGAEEQTRQDESGKDDLHQFPVKLELMSDDDDEYEPTEIRAEDLLTIDAKFPDDSPAAPATTSQRTLRGNRGSAVGGKNGKSGANGRDGAGRKQTEDEEDEDEDDDDDEEEEDDDEGSDFDVENEFNDGLDELLQKAQATKGSSTSKPPTSAKPSGHSSGLVIETITSGNGTTITAAGGSTSTSIPTTGKISVVPTNLLMKQPTSTATSMATPIQIYTQPTMSLGKGTVVPGTVGTSGTGVAGAPMKLLLVNTVGKDGKTQQILTPASETTGTGTGMPKLIPASVHHSKLSVAGQSPIVTIPTMNVPTKVGQQEPHKPGTTGSRPAGHGGQSGGFRTLLTQLVAIQRENLALNQERLALEKERLEFEKQFGGSLVGMVRNMSTFFSGMLQQQRKEQQGRTGEQTTRCKSVEQGRKSPNRASASSPIAVKEQEPTPATIPAGGASLELSEISSSPSSSASTSRVASPTSTTKPPLAEVESEKETKEAGTKRTVEASSLSPAEEPQVTPVPSCTGKPSSTSDVSPPKKRRMMTRNSVQHSQPEDDAEDPLKTEIISDADDL